MEGHPVKLYRPVLIESAEQAEALPKGAVVFDGDPEDGDTYVRAGGDWHTNGHPGVLSEALDLGFTVTALVPIEAEEVRSEDYGSYHLVEALTATAPFTVYVPQEDQ